ncbi:MAG: hypothetical protein V4506_06565 [Bacteroidota bacterium]
MENKKKNQDKIYSTFYWEMKLDKNHPANYSQKVDNMTGYSKYAGHDEAKDKAELLMRKIIMLHSNGYFEKTILITIYMRQGNFLDKSNSIELIKMNKKDYLINDVCKSDQSFYNDFFIKRGVLSFLTRFYDFKALGKDVQYLLPNFKPKFSKEDYFDISKHNFKTRKHLYEYCNKLVNNGHPYEAVMHFQRKYELNKPFDII